ncbi:hypothetical protein LTR66_008780 [Elasticomyces elasticus]|nr:hypothetical protein LTR66_008780 [Elasticomyces elasticus]
MRKRHVTFDVSELGRIAAEAVGAERCVSVEKCSDGLYNKAMILSMEDGRQVIGKVPNPNAGLAHFTTASEVATMDFVHNILGTPVPKVYAWNSKAESNPVGVEYIIMEKIPGVQLERVWNRPEAGQTLKVIAAIAEYQKAWMSASFTRIGCLYYAEDLDPSTSEPWPAIGREWVDDGRAATNFNRGPWTSALDYREAVGHREVASVHASSQFPKQLAMLCGPGSYVPTAERKLSALEAYFKLLRYVLPTDESLATSHIWHNDLHGENIFVDAEDPTKITGIIDWQAVQAIPLFDNSLLPSFLNYEGPPVEGLERPKMPPDIREMSKEDQTAALKLYEEMSLVVVWRRLIEHMNKRLWRTKQYQFSLAWNLLFVSRRIFTLGEATLLEIAVDLKDVWLDLPGVQANGAPDFPLHFTQEQLDEIKRNSARALNAMENMDIIRNILGDMWSEHFCVRHDRYEEAKRKLRETKRKIFEENELDEATRAEWEKFWPFDD